MKVLGIDPGIAHLGYGVVEGFQGTFEWVASGEVQTSQNDPSHKRLAIILDDLTHLVTQYNPDVLAIERLPYMAKFASASRIAEVCGVLGAVAGQHDIDLVEYSPKSVKQAVTGDGDADKHAVIFAVKQMLDYTGKLSNHAADALAVALTHLQGAA